MLPALPAPPADPAGWLAERGGAAPRASCGTPSLDLPMRELTPTLFPCVPCFPPAAKVTLRNIRFQGVDSADAGALAIDMVR